ncbi:MAG: hypothetical protein CL930_13465 [Deltaproteobacteria bacterium]|nr:hypothetical protein [Deltaproteobacteria bacterium]|tara:strand:+ start:1006 stop:1368 length:363 start_codon:yes stop_codon:yes gene_type:complete
MTHVFLSLLMSTAWSQDVTCAQAANETPQSVEANIRQLVDGIINENAIDMGISTLNMKANSSANFQMEGTAKNNASIAVLLKALESEEQTTKVYLVSTEKEAIQDEVRQVFVMTAAYVSK